MKKLSNYELKKVKGGQCGMPGGVDCWLGGPYTLIGGVLVCNCYNCSYNYDPTNPY